MLTAGQRSECARYVLEQARWVIENFDPRPPGSEGEAALQHRLREVFGGCCDGEVLLETFSVSQKAFMAVPVTIAILVALSCAAYWFSPWLGLVFSVAAVLVFWFELLRYRRFTDRFFPKMVSMNVRARRAAQGQAKRRLVLNAHPDGAYEWRLLYRFPRAFRFLVPLTALGVTLKLIFDISFAALGGWSGAHTDIGTWLGLAQILMVPGVLVGLLYTDFRHVSPGANDNLTGTFILAAIARVLDANGLRLANTEVEFLVTGSEEAGLRGAKAHMERHAGDYRDIETVFLAIDTIRELEHFKVYTRDLNGTLKHDVGLCDLIRRAGKENGLDLPCGTIYVGASDAAAFTQAGFKAAAICAMDPAPADYYHNRRDHWNNMDEACVEQVIAVVISTMQIFDSEGLSKA